MRSRIATGKAAAIIGVAAAVIPVTAAAAYTWTQHFYGTSLRNETHFTGTKTLNGERAYTQIEYLTVRVTIQGYGSTEAYYTTSQTLSTPVSTQAYCQWTYPGTLPGGLASEYLTCDYRH